MWISVKALSDRVYALRLSESRALRVWEYKKAVESRWMSGSRVAGLVGLGLRVWRLWGLTLNRSGLKLLEANPLCGSGSMSCVELGPLHVGIRVTCKPEYLLPY